MKRSEINAAISEAKDMIDRYSWVLPKWGYWSKEEYNNNPNLKNYLKNHQMGWDVTDSVSYTHLTLPTKSLV